MIESTSGEPMLLGIAVARVKASQILVARANLRVTVSTLLLIPSLATRIQGLSLVTNHTVALIQIKLISQTSSIIDKT